MNKIHQFLQFTYSALFMFCFHYFIFFCFFNCQILQLNAFDEEHNDIFAELWQKSEEISTESGKCEETLQNSNENFQKIRKIKKEIVVKDEPNDYDEFDQFSNEKQQKIALNKTVKEENVEKRIKSEFMEFDRFSDKEELGDNGKDGEEQNTDSYSMVDNSNLKESSSKSQKGIRKIYSEVEKQEIIAEFDKLNKTKANGMSCDIKKIDEKIAQKLGVSRKTIFNWKRQFVDLKKRKNYTDAEKVELLKNFYKIKKENPQLRTDEIAQMLNINIRTLYSWKRISKGLLKPGAYKIYSAVEKQEIIAEFAKLQNKFKTRAIGMPYDMKKINEKIAQKLGVTCRTIYNWKSQFGVSKKRKNYTDAEKVELLKNFYKIKNEKNPQLRNDEIAQMLHIHIRTVGLWKKKYLSVLEHVDNGGPIDKIQRLGGSEGSTSSANSLNDIPWKWNNFRKKRNKRIGKIRFKCLNSIP